MRSIKIKINGSVKTMSSETKKGVELDIKVTASDLSPVDHDIIGYNGHAFPPGISEADRMEPVRIKGLHATVDLRDREFRYDFGGVVKSTDFDYDAEKKGDKFLLTSSSMKSLSEAIIAQLATALSLEAVDFEVM